MEYNRSIITIGEKNKAELFSFGLYAKWPTKLCKK